MPFSLVWRIYLASLSSGHFEIQDNGSGCSQSGNRAVPPANEGVGVEVLGERHLAISFEWSEVSGKLVWKEAQKKTTCE